VGQIAEMLPGNGYQLVMTETGVIQGFDSHNPLHQLTMVAFKMVQQQLPHVVGTAAMAQQENGIGITDGCRDAGEVIVISVRSLPGLIPIMAMAEILIAAPDAMGPEYGVLHLFSLKAEDIGVAMVEMQDQSMTLIAPGGGPIRFRMVRGDAGLLQQMANAHHRVPVQIGLAQAAAGVNPAFLACGHLHPQAPIPQFGDGRPKGSEEGLHVGHPHSMLERMGEESLQRA
jgi:hypothetical protein